MSISSSRWKPLPQIPQDLAQEAVDLLDGDPVELGDCSAGLAESVVSSALDRAVWLGFGQYLAPRLLGMPATRLPCPS